MIEEVIWNTGTAETYNWEDGSLTPQLYQWERSENTGKDCSPLGDYCNDDVERKNIWEGKVGLMYPSDYGYAASNGGLIVRGKCLYTPLYTLYNVQNCYRTNWLFDTNNEQWTMTSVPDYDEAYWVLAIYSNGAVGKVNASAVGYEEPVTRPVVYLKSSVKIIGGTGEKSSPYELKLEA